ncbi:MAG: (Fe-S)-binding protein [Deltaproteobacteria bacterium]|nr:(Fe-S)-binding protein [Deltaproteobacteria bacterium]
MSTSPKPAQAALFAPCLAEHLLPDLLEATARVLARAGVRPTYPPKQTCCGQMAMKAGLRPQAARLARRFLKLFEDAEAVVAPSGSCVAMVRKYYPLLLADDPGAAAAARDLAARTWELSEFLVDVLGAPDLGSTWPGTAVYHPSCQVHRVLGVIDQPQRLLAQVAGLTLLPLEDAERCCGFGGAFSLEFPDISDSLGRRKALAVGDSGAQYLVVAEVSCLLNIAAFLPKLRIPVEPVHLAQVLAGGLGPA